MHRLLLLALAGLANSAAAEPLEIKAKSDKSGVFHGAATIRDPRPEPASNGDLQRVRWHLQDGFERIVLDLHENDYGSKDTPPLKTPGSYRIANEIYPCRIVCDLTGRQANGLVPELDFSKSALVTGWYRIPILDDAAVTFAFELKEPVEIEVFELHSPARIVLDIRPLARSEKKFSVRTSAVGAGEEVGHLEEQLFINGFRSNRQLRCSRNRFCVEAGLFSTRDEASKLAEKINAAGIPVFVEERGITDPPKISGSPEAP